MMRLFSAIGLLLLIGGPASPGVPSARAQQPIETRTLVEEDMELFVDDPPCWDVRRGSLPSGASSPAAGYHAHGWVVNYVLEGEEAFEYEDGRSDVIGLGEAALIEQTAPHRHDSVGAVARANVNFELSCEPLRNSVGNTDELPAVGPGLYHVQVRERTWAPGARTPVHLLSGPTTTYVLEGTIGRSTASGGGGCSGPGEIYVSPVGELAQNANVGDAPARTVDIDVWPVGEIRTVPQREMEDLPLPAC